MEVENWKWRSASQWRLLHCGYHLHSTMYARVCMESVCRVPPYNLLCTKWSCPKTVRLYSQKIRCTRHSRGNTYPLYTPPRLEIYIRFVNTACLYIQLCVKNNKYILLSQLSSLLYALLYIFKQDYTVRLWNKGGRMYCWVSQVSPINPLRKMYINIDIETF